MNKQAMIEERRGAWWLCTYYGLRKTSSVLPSWNRHLSPEARRYTNHYWFLTAEQALAAAQRDGLVVENAPATPTTLCTCTPHSQDAGGGYFELLLEPEPGCPEHFPLPRLAVRHDPHYAGRVIHRYSIISDESLAWSGLTGGKRPWGDRYDGKYVYPFKRQDAALRYAHKVLANYGTKAAVV